MKPYDYVLAVLFSLLTFGWWLILIILIVPFFILGKLQKRNPRDYYHKILTCFVREISYEKQKYLQNFLKPRDKVLDIGCGSGLRAKLLSSLYNVDFTLCDIDDHNKTNFPFVKFDGRKLPFRNQEFDAVTICFVLHHAKDYKKLLNEARRVSKKYIIILEDDSDGKIAKIYTALHGKFFNWFYQIKNQCQFFSFSQWLDVFTREGLKVYYGKSKWRIDSITYPVKEAVFVVGK